MSYDHVAQILYAVIVIDVLSLSKLCLLTFYNDIYMNIVYI